MKQPAAAPLAAVAEPPGVTAVEASAVEGRSFRYYDFIMAAFVTVLIGSNLIGASKAATLGTWDLGPLGQVPIEFGAGILFFPVSYIIGDILTEVYGYARARRVVWAGFGAVLFIAFMSWAIVSLPPAPRFENQAALETVFGQVPRIVAASVVAFWAGEFANAMVMARMKVWTRGRWLWSRTIGSTAVGQGVDSLLFYPLAFLGVWDTQLVINVMITAWLTKVAWEAFLTPVTYRVIGWLKRAEGVDVYDVDTNLTPFSTRA
ncbi:MAG: queuosine precursor transporter [Sphingomonadaceae bacterium]